MNPQLTSLRQAPQSDPTQVFGRRDCLYATDLLTAALVEFNLFSWLAQKPRSARDIQQHFGIHQRPLDVLLTLLVSWALLERLSMGTPSDSTEYTLTPLAKDFLTDNSPWFIGPYYASLKERPIVSDLLAVLRTGKPANWGSQKTLADWHRSMETPEFAQSFTAAMDCRGVFLSQALAKSLDLSNHHRLLDIAGGSGIYSCALVAENPGLQATVLEKPPVDRIAAQSISRRGASDRVQVIAGDMMTAPLPGAFDVHLWSNVLHDWDVPEVIKLIQASASALPSGGLFVMHDAFLNREKSGPPHVAEYSVMLMHSTQGRCYGVGELEAWLVDAGFDSFHFQETAAARGYLTAIKT